MAQTTIPGIGDVRKFQDYEKENWHPEICLTCYKRDGKAVVPAFMIRPEHGGYNSNYWLCEEHARVAGVIMLTPARVQKLF